MQINLWCFRIRALNSAKELSKIVSINGLMGLILIHSVHRRFIKLLKSQVVKGTPILLTQSDMDEYKNLVHSTF